VTNKLFHREPVKSINSKLDSKINSRAIYAVRWAITATAELLIEYIGLG